MKNLVLILALLASSPAWATWTLTQVKSNNTCTGATCSVTVTSTGSGHLLGVGIIANFSSQTISSVTAGACTGSWTHPSPTTAISIAGGSTDLFYCLSSVSGQTSIVITPSASCAGNTCIAVVWEASSSLGNIAFDSGATPSGTKNNSVNCTACAGVPLTLSGNNDFIIALAFCNQSCTGVTGTGWTNDLANPSGDGIAHGITSGTQTAPATFAQTPTGTMISNAAAFQESSGGGGVVRHRAQVISQ